MFDQISGYCGLAKLRCKINHNTICKNHLGNLLSKDSWDPSLGVLILIWSSNKLPVDLCSVSRDYFMSSIVLGMLLYDNCRAFSTDEETEVQGYKWAFPKELK